MSSIDLVGMLRERAEKFLRYACLARDNGDYDAAMFFAEQAARLRIKASLLRMLGFIPGTHGLRELLSLVARALGDLGVNPSSVSSFAENNRRALSRLEEAYTASRYLPSVYVKEDVEESLAVVKRIFDLMDRAEREVFGV
ncbi:MAG: HEPN domain-containing protein [Thermoproteaceae archaeon]|nr:HEPN domain-containing protein [Thermoproteaceae archaeon]